MPHPASALILFAEEAASSRPRPGERSSGPSRGRHSGRTASAGTSRSVAESPNSPRKRSPNRGPSFGRTASRMGSSGDSPLAAWRTSTFRSQAESTRRSCAMRCERSPRRFPSNTAWSRRSWPTCCRRPSIKGSPTWPGRSSHLLSLPAHAVDEVGDAICVEVFPSTSFDDEAYCRERIAEVRARIAPGILL